MPRPRPKLRRPRRRRTKDEHPLCHHYERYFDETPFPWLCLSGSAALAAAGNLSVDAVVAELQAAVARTTSAADAVQRRLQSIAAWRPQLEAYHAMPVRGKVVCEIGFNAGHSAATWLSAGAKKVHAFDFFRDAHTRAALELLQRRFPDQLVPHAGDATVEVPRAALEQPCDLVVIDGGHSYANVVSDFASMQAHAAPTARFLFDDVCDVEACESYMDGGAIHQGGPTLATCDLERAGLLRLEASAFGGVRQWATFVRGLAVTSTGATACANASRDAPLVPGCAPRCRLRWGGSGARQMQRIWDGHDSPFGDRARAAQQTLSGCCDGKAREGST